MWTDGGVNLLAAAGFVVASCGTPGPNNTMVLASGVNHGLRRSLPHLAGINVGFPLMVLAVGLGLGEALARWPFLLDVLRPVGAAYLLYLAYRIATTPVGPEADAELRPMTFAAAALFQLANPKAWVIAVGALVTYTTAGDGYGVQVAVIAFIFFLLGTPCTLAWLFGGVVIGGTMRRPAHRRAFNVAMAGLLVLSLVPVLAELLGDWGLTRRG